METFGSLIDKLTIVNIKLYHQEDIAHDPEASDSVVANAKRRIDVLNLQRNQLIQEIDELLRDVVAGNKSVPVVPQCKDYGRKK